MPKVKIVDRLIKKHKIRPFIIKGVGNQFQKQNNQRLYKKYNDISLFEDHRYFVVYEFQEENDDIITLIREMKRTIKK
jgi:hypothetical protein